MRILKVLESSMETLGHKKFSIAPIIQLSMKIISIVPCLPPAIDGVGDYALLLAQQLQQQAGLDSNFIVARSSWQADGAINHAAQALTQRSSDTLLKTLIALDSTVVLLHYVPHGYARKACPFWLLQGLEAWKAHNSQARIVTMFHELYAFDWQRPWSSDFWLSPVQKTIATKLSQLSDICLTTTEKYAKSLCIMSHRQHSDPFALPVFSNIGEPTSVLNLSQRQPRLVIFGQQHSKQKVYRHSLAVLTRVCEKLNIEEIFDLGPQTGSAPAQIGQSVVRELGALPMHELRDILAGTKFGFLAYDPGRLAKSGIFAAYCAYGILPINATQQNIRIDGLALGEHYITPKLLLQHSHSLNSLQRMANNAHTWYSEHNLSQQAKVFAVNLTASTLGDK